jgi:hypothetical protein
MGSFKNGEIMAFLVVERLYKFTNENIVNFEPNLSLH